MATNVSIWKPIAGLDSQVRALASSELATLAPIWLEQKRRLEQAGALNKFNAKLRRQWAIETGVIEGLYDIDRGTTELLIEKGLELSLMPYGSTSKPAAEVLEIVNDQAEVLDWIFDFVRGQRPISTSFIKEMHSLFTRHQLTTEAQDSLGRRIEVPLVRGEWKTLPNNPRREDEIFFYCPPEQVSSEMDSLILINERMVSHAPEIHAAWLHHRFTQIHPFQDGNGRVARALATLIFIRAGWFPLTITRGEREEYILSLEKADRDDIQPLVALFSRLQKEAFLRALAVSAEAMDQKDTTQKILDAAIDRLRARFDRKPIDYARVFDTASDLMEVARTRLEIVANELSTALASIDANFSASVMDDHGRQDWYRGDAVELSKAGGYFADMRSLHRWVRLTIREARSMELVIVLHAIGRDFVGVIGGNAFIKYRDTGEDGERVVEGPKQLAEGIFHFAYNEPDEVVRERFQGWLESVLFSGIESWRRGL